MNYFFTKKLTCVIRNILLLFIVFAFINCSSKTPIADMILVNGNIITVDTNNNMFEAIAIANDTIMTIGTNKKIREFLGDSTKIIDLKGKTVIPGFIDSHAHLIGTGKAHINLNLGNAKNWDEVVYLVAKVAAKARKGEWIVGRGWHQEKWNPLPLENVGGYPLHNKLSEATPDNPVLLSHASGHAVIVNAVAMDLAKINSETKNPRGGKIVKNSSGEAIGVFTEAAENLIRIKYNKYLNSKSFLERKNDKKNAIKLAINECLSYGITTLHDAGATFEDLRVIKEMVDSNEIKIRLYEMILENYSNLKDSLRAYHTVGYGNNHLTVQAIKLYMDGALGSRGAWLLSPYKDIPEQHGLNVTTLSEIKNIVNLAAETDFQICTHAIGDKGNRVTLNIYDEAFKKYQNINNRRWRIEHAQHLAKKDIIRFAELGVVASMQGVHCTSDASFVEKRLGQKRAETGAYVWQSLINSGVVICNGTDSPVEEINPLANFYSSVTRRTNDGKLFYPNQKMNRMEALRSYTINGAYAAFEENIKGSLEIGKLADLTVLSKDILTVSDEDILNTNVVMTIVGGKILYEKKN